MALQVGRSGPMAVSVKHRSYVVPKISRRHTIIPCRRGTRLFPPHCQPPIAASTSSSNDTPVSMDASASLPFSDPAPIDTSAAYIEPLPATSASEATTLDQTTTTPDQTATTPDATPDAPPTPIQTFLNRLRNALLVPFTAFLTIVRWCKSFPGWAQAQHIKRLRELSNEDATSADKHAALLMELNKVSPKEVITRVQSRQYATNAAVAVEFLKALVSTGQITEYSSPASAASATPTDHRSLPQLLRELQQQAEGGFGEEEPGASSRRPLHVLMAGPMSAATGASAAPARSWPLRLFGSLFWLSFVFGAVAFAWLVGGNIVRRVAAPGGGMAASMGSVSTTAGMAGVEPKEYKKEELPEKSVKTFKDVKGCDEAKAELQEVVDFLQDPQRFMRLGAKLPKGVLLTGPPGTGKTLLAKAVAGEAAVPFFYRAGSEFEELYVGVGARRMRALFAAAKKRAPCIVFIDEIDAIGGNRKHFDNHTRKTLNQLLVEMDGFEGNEGVIVMAATNLAETLDPALKRPGRFDRQVAVPLPDIRGRQQLLEYYLGDKPVDVDVDADLLARQSAGFSGADLSNLVNEAALQAAKMGRDALTASMLDYAFDKICMGVERKSVRRSLESLRRTAYHEAGHAIVALHMPGAKPIHKATIVPRGHALGMVTQVGTSDEFSVNKEQMLADIHVCMGGKVAEELIFGKDKVTSGCTNDLKQATRLARHMVTECGQSDAIGPIYIPDGDKGVSEDLRQRVDAEVRQLLVDAQEAVIKMLREQLGDLHALATALLDNETLTSAEITAALKGELPAREKAVLTPPAKEGGALLAEGGLAASVEGDAGSLDS